MFESMTLGSVSFADTTPNSTTGGDAYTNSDRNTLEPTPTGVNFEYPDWFYTLPEVQLTDMMWKYISPVLLAIGTIGD